MSDFILKALNTEISNHALEKDKLPTRIKILNWGKSDTTSGPVYLDERSMSVFDKWQKKSGREVGVALDFEHNTVPESDTYVKGKAVDIAAYGDPEIIKGDGLYLNNLEWTPVGEEKAKNYKDLSPAAITTKEGVVVGLHSTALTTNGAVYKLNFYSANNLEDMITKLSVKDYNKDNANAGANQVGDKYVANTNLSVDEASLEKTADSQHETNSTILHADECLCPDCIDPKKLSAVQEKLKLTTADEPTTMSAKNAQPYKNMETKIKTMAVEAVDKNKESQTDSAKVLFAFLAEFLGQHPEFMEQITKKSNTEDGGLKQWSVKVDNIAKEVATFKAELSEKQVDNERQTLISQATKEGKVITLSANAIKKLDLTELNEYVSKLEISVPMKSKMKILSADATGKPSRIKAVELFNEMLK